MDAATSPRTPKRKRSSSPASTPANQQPASINPFSFDPSTLYQFRVAGLADTDSHPAKIVPNFPHRGIRSAVDDAQEGQHGPEPNDAEEGEEAGAKKSAVKKSVQALRDRQLSVLIQSINHLLDRGDIARASRAYAIALQLGGTGAGKKFDIRHHNLWAMGAELIMREGETPISERSPESVRIQLQRWGSARNMPKLRAYFEALIQQYPTDEKRPNKLSSRDFWAALVSCEIYNVHTEHVIGLRRLEQEQGGKEEDFVAGNDFYENEEYDIFDEGEETPELRSKARSLAEKEKLRKRALAEMEDIARRMNRIIHELPYRKDIELLQLRATVSLYLGDLLIPLAATSTLAVQRAQDQRQGEHDEARAALESVLRLGGSLNSEAMAFLGLDEEAEMHEASTYSSLPISVDTEGEASSGATSAATFSTAQAIHLPRGSDGSDHCSPTAMQDDNSGRIKEPPSPLVEAYWPEQGGSRNGGTTERFCRICRCPWP